MMTQEERALFRKYIDALLAQKYDEFIPLREEIGARYGLSADAA